MIRLSLPYFLSLGVLVAQQPSARQLAGLEQDVVELRTEVAKLAQQMDDLDQSVRALRNQPTAAAPAASREAILTEVDRRIAALRADLDRALAAFTKQVNQALAARGTAPEPALAPAASSSPAASAEPALPPDMPRTGIRYRVRAGDTLSAVARRNNSKVDWILKANQMDNPNALRVDDEIFIPQP